MLRSASSSRIRTSGYKGRNLLIQVCEIWSSPLTTASKHKQICIQMWPFNYPCLPLSQLCRDYYKSLSHYSSFYFFSIPQQKDWPFTNLRRENENNLCAFLLFIYQFLNSALSLNLSKANCAFMISTPSFSFTAARRTKHCPLIVRERESCATKAKTIV